MEPIRDDREHQILELSFTVRGLADASKATTDLLGKMADKQEHNSNAIAKNTTDIAVLMDRAGNNKSNLAMAVAVIGALVSVLGFVWKLIHP